MVEKYKNPSVLSETCHSVNDLLVKGTFEQRFFRQDFSAGIFEHLLKKHLAGLGDGKRQVRLS